MSERVLVALEIWMREHPGDQSADFVEKVVSSYARTGNLSKAQSDYLENIARWRGVDVQTLTAHQHLEDFTREQLEKLRELNPWVDLWLRNSFEGENLSYPPGLKAAPRKARRPKTPKK
jgi:hypothetical protein